MNFMLRSLVRYCSCHSNIKFISSRHRVISSIYYFYRELKNKATGLDIRVPQYEHISGPFGGVVMYHVIVVTQLFYFKTPNKHKESDVVQFMVSVKN